MDWLCLRKTALFLDAFAVFILHVSTDIQGHTPICPVFKVRRGTVHKVCINKPFRISCDLKYCDDQRFSITWTKANLWTPVLGSAQTSSSQNYSSPDLLTSYLTFTNISKDHDGLYRCELQLSNSSAYSHYINISVSENSMEDEMSCTEKEKDNTERDTTDTSSDLNPWWLPYLFICVGVVIAVLMLTLIFILCIIGSKTSRKRKTQRAQVQYTATSVLTSPSPSVLKRDGIVQYSEETWRHSHGRNTCSLTLPPVQFTSPLSDCGGDDCLSNWRENRSSQVLYASLNHLTPAPSSTTPRPTREEFSEYASIRVS
ncbi:B- and T-lymphocyte attenuator isoform X2 [Pseudorasbora parva]|uniref:B- and T-lymphocyte attenuator isoform X2 n=1 Tax=Pseudorasbora parva TaxID=51549 RepID=UPI00351EBB18